MAAVEHHSGNVLGQEAVADKTNEIPTVRTLATGLALKGREGFWKLLPGRAAIGLESL